MLHCSRIENRATSHEHHFVRQYWWTLYVNIVRRGRRRRTVHLHEKTSKCLYIKSKMGSHARGRIDFVLSVSTNQAIVVEQKSPLAILDLHDPQLKTHEEKIIKSSPHACRPPPAA